jgi:hypothetical protein
MSTDAPSATADRPADGEYALRTREGWGGRPAVDEPVPEEPEPGGYAEGGDD